MTEQENSSGVINSFKSNFNIQGTATRSRYWGTIIITWFLIVAGLMMTVAIEPLISLIGVATLVACIWCLVAVTIKRCRDAGVSPWWTFGTILPLIGWIVTIALGVIRAKQDN